MVSERGVPQGEVLIACVEEISVGGFGPKVVEADELDREGVLDELVDGGFAVWVGFVGGDGGGGGGIFKAKAK